MIIHSGRRIQTGSGIGAIFSGLRRLIPFAMRSGKQILKSNLTKNIIRGAKKEAKRSLTGLTQDILRGDNVKESAKKRLNQTKRKIINEASQHLLNKPKSRKYKKKIMHKKNTRKPKNYLFHDEDDST